MNSDEKILMKGNEAIAEAAIRAGCTAYFGYPITPQNEIIAYMAKHMLEKNRIFIQSESEVAAINMVYGASAAGARAMTSSSSPGISLKQEGISYAAGADLPLVVVNMVRGGPGLGNIAPYQGDYFQATRGGGHGDYRTIVLAPKSVQECADLTYLAFDLADQYRVPVMVMADGMIGQMMEGVILPPERRLDELPKRDWTVGRMRERGDKSPRHISSLELTPEILEKLNLAREERYAGITDRECRYESADEDGDLILVAYGTAARIALGAKKLAASEGIKLGIFRPVTLWPFPAKALGRVAASGRPILTVELSFGQLVEDVKLSVFEASGGGKCPAVHLLGHSGGTLPTEEEIFARAKKILGA
ncbi:MAG: 3-methyl-2-oxobutanoate dehydrogenase subunit VorB [Spirochaetaceae bacterium]|jgi:2-oxoglutarate ferredoxin oxidoreductase subunit alpha|nr:3-methyl-2-oxobutanoate dehydrogenase subunit VorB [Spirochaetaceae bacterium]